MKDPLPRRLTVRLLLFSLAWLLVSTASVSAQGQVAVLSSIDAPNLLLGPFVFAPDGNLYTYGGQGSDPQLSCIFKVDLDGNVSPLYTFSLPDSGGINSDGYNPTSLLVGSDGALYGTTQSGGAQGDGTIFRLSLDGGFDTLYSGSETDGPFDLNVQGSDGYIYGNFNGRPGAGAPSADGTYGKIFRIPVGGGMPEVVYAFTGPDGYYPTPYVAGSDGSIYGTAYTQADALDHFGYDRGGEVFKLASDGSLTVVQTFTPGVNGSAVGELIAVGNDTFDGFTAYGPDYDPSGTLFQFTADGAFATLHSGTDAANSDHSFNFGTGGVLGRDGNFYFVSSGSGADSSGYIWSCAGDGSSPVTLFTFPTDGSDGNVDNGADNGNSLVETSDGVFYGHTAAGGGANGRGTIYRAVLYTIAKPVVTITAMPVKIDEKRGVRAKVIVERSGDKLTSPLKVSLQFGGTAVNGKDYKKLAPTVTIPAGAAKGVLYVKALNVGRKHGNQKANINVTATASSPYTVGKPSKATVTIEDND